MYYSNVYYGNTAERKPLLEGSWALKIISYVTNHSTISNLWLPKKSCLEICPLKMMIQDNGSI